MILKNGIKFGKTDVCPFRKGEQVQLVDINKKTDQYLFENRAGQRWWFNKNEEGNLYKYDMACPKGSREKTGNYITQRPHKRMYCDQCGDSLIDSWNQFGFYYSCQGRQDTYDLCAYCLHDGGGPG